MSEPNFTNEAPLWQVAIGSYDDKIMQVIFPDNEDEAYNTYNLAKQIYGTHCKYFIIFKGFVIRQYVSL